MIDNDDRQTFVTLWRSITIVSKMGEFASDTV